MHEFQMPTNGIMCVLVCKAKVIPVYDCSSDLVSVVLEETGGLGVDIFVDSGGK